MRILALAIVLGVCACGATQEAGTRDVDQAPQGAELARSPLSRATDPVLEDSDASTFSADNRAFALALYHQLANPSANLVFSPYSISTALAMTYAGAKGQTASEVASALHFSLEPPQLHAAFNASAYDLAGGGQGLTGAGDGFELELVNQAWGRKGYRFLDGYLDVLARHYGTGLFLVDFSAAERARMLINGWVAKQTQQRINELLPANSLTRDTALVLTEAVYFKARWSTPFDPSMTAVAAFAAPDGTREVPMMHAHFDGQYAQVAGYQAVALPYRSRDTYMLLVLPPEGTFEQAVAGLDTQLLDTLHENLRASDYNVVLSLPKWSFDAERALEAPLRALGMQAAFERKQADFSGMDGTSRLWIDDIYQKAFISVDEQGTEATAAAAVATIEFTRFKGSAEVQLDRPFVFVVYDEPTGQILFLGQVVDPS